MTTASGGGWRRRDGGRLEVEGGGVETKYVGRTMVGRRRDHELNQRFFPLYVLVLGERRRDKEDKVERKERRWSREEAA
ncbi:hypothetical protein LINPERHAP2_LOCUS39510 [Linum perenne]